MILLFNRENKTIMTKILEIKFKVYKAAFTLAEVLITLGIIGIVSAITIPVIAAKIRGKQLQTQFMKTYSDLNRAARLYYAENEMTVKDSYTSGNYPNVVLTNFISMFKGASKNTNLSPANFDTTNNLSNYNLNGKKISNYPCDASYVVTDMSGRLFSTDGVNTFSFDYGPKICVDINGISRPNKWGVDRFVFVFTSDNAVIPYTGTSWSDLTEQISDENIIKNYCNTNITPPVHTCAYFALKNISPDGKGDYWYDFINRK